MAKTNVTVTLSGENGNIYSLVTKVSKALRKAGHRKLEVELQTKVLAAKSYDHALTLIGEYVVVQ